MALIEFRLKAGRLAFEPPLPLREQLDCASRQLAYTSRREVDLPLGFQPRRSFRDRGLSEEAARRDSGSPGSAVR